jgi:hypothetical protein
MRRLQQIEHPANIGFGQDDLATFVVADRLVVGQVQTSWFQSELQVVQKLKLRRVRQVPQ